MIPYTGFGYGNRQRGHPTCETQVPRHRVRGKPHLTQIT